MGLALATLWMVCLNLSETEDGTGAPGVKYPANTSAQLIRRASRFENTRGQIWRWDASGAYSAQHTSDLSSVRHIHQRLIDSESREDKVTLNVV